MGKKRKVSQEVVPLMTAQSTRGQRGSVEHGFSDDDSDEDDESCWLKVVVDPNKRHKGSSLLAIDAVILILHYLQVLALIESIALRWPWPEAWLSWAKYLFLANADIWEFLKVYTPDVYKYVQNYYVPSIQVPLSYVHLLAGWGGFLVILLIIYIGCYMGFSCRPSPRMLVRLSILKQLLVIAVQLLAIPLGVVLIRLFHCTDDNFMDVKNDVYCFHGTHWAYLAPALVILLLFFVAFPMWLIIRTHDQMMNMTNEQHEGYLQLKEMEYVHGLDIIWLVGNFHIFASFKKPGVHMRACHLIALGVLVIVYGALARFPFYQAVILTCCLFVLFLTFLCLCPFRVKAYNVILCVNYFCLTVTALMGSFKTSYQVGVVDSPWLLPYYQNLTLIIVNGFWLLCVIVFILYIIIRNHCCQRRQKTPLWPHKKFHKLSPHTRKYIRGIIISRLLIEKVLASVPMFAPVHEVARYIHVINSYCREAELLHDPLQNTLWDILDQLIDVHTNIAPRSLFSESTKDSIRHTAEEFMALMPGFVRRLAQREYDFILINPTKRRIILKLYCLSLFLKCRKERRTHHELTVPTIQKLWHKPDEDDSDPGYYEDMYPRREPLVTQRPLTYDPDMLLRLEDEDEEEEDTDAVIAETEAWLRGHGIAGGQRSDPLAEWLGELGLRNQRPETVGSELLLPSDFTIPELDDPRLHTPQPGSSRGTGRLGTPHQDTPQVSQPGTGAFRHSTTHGPMLSPQPSMLGPGRSISTASMSRPTSAASMRMSAASLHPSVSAASLGSIPGAVEDPPESNPRSGSVLLSRPPSAGTTSTLPHGTTPQDGLA